MASTSYYTKPPLPRSMSCNMDVPARSKTPGPNPVSISEKLRRAENLPKRARTPLPHEEDTRFSSHRKTRTTSRTSSPSGEFVDHDAMLHRVHTRAGHGRSHTIPNTYPTSSVESTWKDASDAHAYGAGGVQAESEQQHPDHAWDRSAYDDVDCQVQVWMMQEEMHRKAAAREAERTRLVQEEVRRIQAKILLRQEFERLRILEEIRLGHDGDERQRDRARRQPKGGSTENSTVANAWAIYERNWAAISSSSEPLAFAIIPWPMLNRPSGPSSITLPAVSTFLLSEAHSTSLKPKERIKEALRRWHPDRFVRFLGRVPLEERGIVDEAVGIVTRCLNELMSRYSG